MIQSIVVYSFMCFVLYYATLSSYEYSRDNGICIRKTRVNAIGLLFALFVFAFFSGVRWDVGVDHLEYMRNYLTVGIIGDVYRNDMEEGYVYLMRIFNTIGAHYSVFFGTIAFIQLFFLYYAFKDHRYIIPYLGVLIMCGGDFFFWMNGIRQALVATFFVCLITHFIVKKKFVLYIICIYIASFIHKSALLLLVFYPITYLELDKFFIKRHLQYIIFFLALFLASLNMWIHLLDTVDVIFSFIGYDERFKMERLEDNIREQNFGIRKILFFLIDVITIYYSVHLRAKYSNKIFGFVYLMYLILIVTQPLFMSSLVFNRITGYFYVFRAIVSAYLLFYLFKIDKTRINQIIGTLILLFYMLHLFVQIYVDKGGHTGCIRYQFFWDIIRY